MEKTEIRPLFQLMASWPKKSNFERVKTFLGPKKFRGYPILGFLTLKSTKKWFVLIRNITKLAIFQHANFVMFLMKTNHFLVLLRVKNPKMEYLKHILGLKNILTPSKLDFLGQDPVNWNWGPILVFDEKCHFFGTFKGQKSQNGVPLKYFGALKYFDPLKVGFFWPGGHELK